MDIENLNSLKKEIFKCKQRLLELEPQADSNENIKRIYNKVLIRKAVLMQRYKKACYKPTFKDKVKKFLRKSTRNKLICDYWNA